MKYQFSAISLSLEESRSKESFFDAKPLNKFSEICDALYSEGVVYIEHANVSNQEDCDIIDNLVDCTERIGSLIPQNGDGELAVLVQDRGERMETGGRYHLSNQGGSIHSDGPMIQNPPDFVALICLQQAESGGESVLVDCRSTVSKMLRFRPGCVEVLRQPMPFDCRNYYLGTPAFIQAPPLELSNQKRLLRSRFLKDYIISGHIIAKQPLLIEVQEAIEQFDHYLSDPSAARVMKLRRGSGFIINNSFIGHGRTAFRDTSTAKRKMLRLWMRSAC